MEGLAKQAGDVIDFEQKKKHIPNQFTPDTFKPETFEPQPAFEPQPGVPDLFSYKMNKGPMKHNPQLQREEALRQLEMLHDEATKGMHDIDENIGRINKTLDEHNQWVDRMNNARIAQRAEDMKLSNRLKPVGIGLGALGLGVAGIAGYRHHLIQQSQQAYQQRHHNNHHEKTAGLVGKVKNFAQDFTGKNAEKAHHDLVQTMKLEREKKVPSSEISKKIKTNAIANENKFKARKQSGIGAATVVAGGAASGGLAYAAHKPTKREKEEGL